MTREHPPASSPGARRLPELALELERTLEAERDALALRDNEALLAAVENKRRILREVTKATADLRQKGLGLDPELGQTLTRCRALNESSGSTIAALLHDTRRALGMLGVSSEPATYGESGHGVGRLPQRAIATC